VIETINETFVSSWIIMDDIQKRLGKEHFAMATMLVDQHQYPLDFVFLSPQGKLVTRLTSFEDLRNANPAVGHPHRDGERSHVEVFLDTVKQHFGG